MAETVFSGVANDIDMQGTLFQGIKFWVSHKVPQRSRFLGDIKANGGEVLPLEKHADIKIVDHARKEAPPGSHSYTFIEKSIRNGALEDLDDHKAGPPEGNIRSIGSVVQPAKGTRNKYTEADDRILWDWVHDNPQKGGGTGGNEIYKQLEKKHPQHPWQSWRDRWIKHLKDTKTHFPLPCNAPPTPPLDISSTSESSKDQETTSDTADDEYLSFSDEDAEALMVNGDDILNIYPDNIPEAWKSWARDYDKNCVHTAQRWQLYWEKSVRPRYLKRNAKQARRASSEKTIPARSQVADLPKKSTVSLPSTPSPASKLLTSLLTDSPGQGGTFGIQKNVSPREPVVIPPSGFSVSVSKDHSLKPAARSPSYHPESPKMTATAPLVLQKPTDTFSMQEPSLPSSNKQHIPRTPEKARSLQSETLKRKHVPIEEDLPSSSPLGPVSPKRRRPSGSELPIEIASTPEKSSEDHTEESSSPLVINLELEEDATSPANHPENDSPLGQQLSDTLSEPGHTIRNTQTLFENATPLIDFDVAAPEGGWDNEDLLVQNSSQPVSLDVPLVEKSEEDDKHSSRESTQLVDFDLPAPEDGWDEQDLQVKEPKSPNTEISDPQPILPDTQAIFRSKTPAPDFSIPDPDGGWDSLIASSPPIMPDSPRAESVFSHTDLKEQMDAWIDAHATKGISVEQVESVLKSTSMDTALADRALRHLAKKGALPTDRRGVWTEADDEDLKSTDARKIQRLQEKHGADCLTARWEFLDFYADEA